MFFSPDFRCVLFETLFPWAGKPARGGERVNFDMCTWLSHLKFLLVFRIFGKVIRSIFLNCSPASGTFVSKANQLDTFVEIRLGLLEMFFNSQQVPSDKLEIARSSQLRSCVLNMLSWALPFFLIFFLLFWHIYYSLQFVFSMHCKIFLYDYYTILIFSDLIMYILILFIFLKLPYQLLCLVHCNNVCYFTSHSVIAVINLSSG